MPQKNYQVATCIKSHCLPHYLQIFGWSLVNRPWTTKINQDHAFFL